MARFIQEGRSIDYTPLALVAAGAVVKIGNNFFGVALRSIAAGALGSLRVEGVVEAPKGDGTIASGAICFWDADNEIVTTTPVANGYMGRAVAAASGTTVWVLLNGTNIGAVLVPETQATPAVTQSAIAALTAANPTCDAADPAITAVNPAEITAANPAAITAVDPAAITAVNPDAATAAVEDIDNTKILADVGSIRTQLTAAIADITATRAEVVKAIADVTATRAELVKAIADVTAIRTQLVAGIADLATLRDSDKAIIDDVEAIETSLEAGIVDLATLKTAANAAKTDLAAVVAGLTTAGLFE